MSTYEFKKINDFCKTGSGGTPSRSKSEYFINGSIPWVKSGELKDRFVNAVEEYITEEAIKNSSAKVVPENALLIAMYGATVGEVSQLKFDAATNQAICNIIPDPSVCDANYLYRFLEAIKPELLARRVGGGQPNISQSIIKETIVPLPPLPEQRRIAAILDKADELRQKRRQAIEKLDQLLQATFIDMFGDPVSNPKGWPLETIGNVLTFKGGGTPSRSVSQYWDGDIPWATVKDFNFGLTLKDTQERISIHGLKNSASNLIPKDTLIIPTRMALGKAAISEIDLAINQDLKAVIPQRSDLFHVHYLLWFFLSNQSKITNMGKGATVKGITLDQLNQLVIPVPPLNIQVDFSNLVKCINSLQLVFNSNLDKLESLFYSMQQRAFSGNL